MKKRIQKFSVYNETLDRHIVAAPLIGQIGKNFSDGADGLITGDELLHIACDVLEDVQHLIGGRIVYLECENNPKLIQFYQSNDFIRFGIRIAHEESKEKKFIQLLQYLR